MSLIAQLTVLILKVLSAVYGDYLLAKWVAEIRNWWETNATTRSKLLVELHYKKISSKKHLYKKDRDQI